MNFRKQLRRIALGTGLALTLAVVPGTWATSSSSSAAQMSNGGTSAQARGMSAMSASAGKLDINSASEGELKALPGIGDVYAKKIIASRPYRAKNDLVSRGILPQGLYDKIKKKLVATRSKK